MPYSLSQFWWHVLAISGILDQRSFKVSNRLQEPLSSSHDWSMTLKMCVRALEMAQGVWRSEHAKVVDQ
jgi:hypothetical protein